MAPSRFDLILHPVRLQILLAVQSAPGATFHELGRRFPDVPPESLSAHVGLLVTGGLLASSELAGKDGPDLAYSIVRHEGSIPEDERRLITPADHLRHFTAFAAALIDIFARYLKRPDVDVVADGVEYRQEVLHLTDEEHRDLVNEIQARLDGLSRKPAGGKRKTRIFSWIVVPEGLPADEV